MQEQAVKKYVYRLHQTLLLKVPSLRQFGHTLTPLHDATTLRHGGSFIMLEDRYLTHTVCRIEKNSEYNSGRKGGCETDRSQHAGNIESKSRIEFKTGIALPLCLTDSPHPRIADQGGEMLSKSGYDGRFAC